MNRGRFWPRRVTTVVLFILASVLSLWSGACSAYRRPAAFTPAELQLLAEPPLSYSISIEPRSFSSAPHAGANPESYAGAEARTLKASHTFRASQIETQPSNHSDLVARPIGMYCNSAIVPMFTLLSLGIIPTVWGETDCHGVEIRSARSLGGAPSIKVQYSDTGKAVMGWAAVIMGAMPGWSYGSSRDDSRYAVHFRLEVLRHRDEIAGLIAR